MAVISGKEGTVYFGGVEETPISNWKIKTTVNISPYAANDTGGWKNKVVGVKDWSGSFTIKDKSTLASGDSASAVFYDGLQYTWTGAIKVVDVDTEADINDGTEMSYEVTFEGHGALAIAAGSAP